MPHYVYEVPAGSAPIRQINAFPGYVDASAFANEERAKQSFHDAGMIVVVQGETAEEGDAAARRLQEQFEEARRSRPAPAARVSHFIREYGSDTMPSPPALLAQMQIPPERPPEPVPPPGPDFIPPGPGPKPDRVPDTTPEPPGPDIPELPPAEQPPAPAPPM